MKPVSWLLLICLSLFMVPLVSAQSHIVKDSSPALASLNMCDAQAAGIQATPDIVLISECARGLLPAGSRQLHVPSRPELKSFIISVRCERPPEA